MSTRPFSISPSTPEQPEEEDPWPDWLPDIAVLDVLFWALLAVALFLLIRPLWTGPIFPAWDFGGHLAMADIWARLEDVELYRQLYERRSGLYPNSVAVRFTSWLYPLVGTLTGMRIFVTLSLLGTVLALYATLRTFGRSRWLLFGCLPFLWNGSFYWGMVNYVAAFPFFFAAIVLARRTGRSAHWRWGVPLGLVCLASFFIHGLGCPLTLGAAGLILVCSIRRLWALAWSGVLAPPAALWWYWRSNVEGKGVPQGGLFEVLENANYFGPIGVAKEFLHQALDATVHSKADLWMVFILIGIWVLWMSVSRGTAQVVSEFEGDAADVGLLRRWASDAYRQIDQHALLILAIVLYALFLLVPGYIGPTNVKARFVPLVAWTLMMVPRLPRRNVIAAGATAGAIAISCWVGVYMQHYVDKIHRLEFEPLVKLLDQMPEQQRLECMNIVTGPGGDGPIFRGRPVGHNCSGLAHVRRTSFGRFGFPKTAYNAIKYRKDARHPSVRHGNYSQVGAFQVYDYLAIRGRMQLPPKRLATLVAKTGGNETKYDRKSTIWRLYKIREPKKAPDERMQAGGRGGVPFHWSCSDGEALAGIAGSFTGAKRLGSVQPLCRSVQPVPAETSDSEEDESRGETSDTPSPVLETAGDPVAGPSVGSQGIPKHQFRAVCPEGQFLVGLKGRAGIFIDRVELLCAPVVQRDEDGPEWRKKDVQQVGGNGGKGGDPFRLTCEHDEVATELVGRNGTKIDALGVRCSAIGQFTDSSK